MKPNTPNWDYYFHSLNLPSFDLFFPRLPTVVWFCARFRARARVQKPPKQIYKTAKNGVEAKLIWFTNNVYKFYFIEYNLFDHFINLSVISINSGSQKSKRSNELTIEHKIKHTRTHTTRFSVH